MSKKHALISLFLLLTAAIGLNGCAPALVGVGTAAIAASSTEKGFSTSVNDAVILTKISDRYLQENLDLTEAVSISVNDGSVLLTGNIETFDLKLEATRLAWEIKGVREVINELNVAESKGIKDVAKDLAAAAELRAKLITDGEVSSLNFTIDVVSGVVYISGIARSNEEREAVINHARGLRYAKKVVDYTVLSRDTRE